MSERESEPLALSAYLPYRLAVLSGRIGRSGARLYRRYFGFGQREWRVMAVLGEMGELPLSRLAEFASIDSGTATRALAALVRLKLVNRRPDETDARKVLFLLSESGRHCYGTIARNARVREEFLLSALTPRERATFDRLLEKLEARAPELDALDPFAADDESSQS